MRESLEKQNQKVMPRQEKTCDIDDNEVNNSYNGGNFQKSMGKK